MQEKAGKIELKSPTSASVVLYLTGDEPKTWQVDVSGTKVSLKDGETATDAPTLKVTTSDEVLLKVAAKELSPTAAYFTGKIKINGDVSLLSHLKDILPDG